MVWVIKTVFMSFGLIIFIYLYLFISLFIQDFIQISIKYVLSSSFTLNLFYNVYHFIQGKGENGDILVKWPR